MTLSTYSQMLFFKRVCVCVCIYTYVYVLCVYISVCIHIYLFIYTTHIRTKKANVAKM